MSQNPVTVAEALSICVGTHIIQRGALAPANNFGTAIDSLADEDSLGLLEGSQPLKKKWFFDLLTLRLRRPFIGVLWFKNQSRGATYKKWLLEVHGRAYQPMLQELAEELAAKFGVEIHVRLISEATEMEYLPDRFY